MSAVSLCSYTRWRSVQARETVMCMCVCVAWPRRGIFGDGFCGLEKRMVFVLWKRCELMILPRPVRKNLLSTHENRYIGWFFLCCFCFSFGRWANVFFLRSWKFDCGVYANSTNRSIFNTATVAAKLQTIQRPCSCMKRLKLYFVLQNWIKTLLRVFLPVW